ncbi:MAG: phosphatidylglycerol:prolipoprotein diacylglycerol transferase, partial [Bacteroidia bacterium]
MYPQLFHFKTPGFFPDFFPDYVSLYSYGFFIALGVLVSFWFVLKRAKALGVSSDQLANLYMFCIVAGFVGGKLFYYLEDWAKYMAHPKLML